MRAASEFGLGGANVQFLFADHTLDTDRRELHRGAESIAVEPQVFDLLIYLVQNRDRVVSKDDLIASVWDGRIVSDSTLTSRINAARKAVGDSGEDQKLIRTIARRGFRFVGAVHTQSSGDEPTRAVGLTAAAGMAGHTEAAVAALQELRRTQPNISLGWIASEMPIMQGNELEHYLEAFRRAGLK